jgi:predicted nucleic acid-binding protein
MPPDRRGTLLDMSPVTQLLNRIEAGESQAADDLRLAADFWARARQHGYPTAPDPALDIDVIIAAQAIGLGVPVIVATGNVGHLSRFVAAELWQNVAP